MIPKYKDLFIALEKFDIKYTIPSTPKGLEDDLLDVVGDLDIVVKEWTEDLDKAMFYAGFSAIKWPCKFDGMWFYISYCAKSKKTALVHFHTYVPLGKHKVLSWLKHFKWSVAEELLNHYRISTEFKVKTLKPQDELAYLLLRIALKGSHTECEDVRLRDLCIIVLKGKLESNLLSQVLRYTFKDKNTFLEEVVQSSDLKETLFEFKCVAEENLSEKFASKIGLLCQKYSLRMLSFIRRVFGAPQMRKAFGGRIVAFIGVDGAGKSTQIDLITKTDYFKRTGIKRIYFGLNEFWMPGLQYLHRIANSSKKGSFARKLCILLTIIDRRMRLFNALFYKIKGYLVICDRYFYDDLMHCQKVKSSGRSSKSIKFLNFLNNRIGYVPDATIYLRISGEEAYSRKKDCFESEKVENVAIYDDILLNRSEVNVIDATLTVDEIHALIAPILLPELQNVLES